MKKTIVLASLLVITGCAASITMPPNTTVAENGEIKDITFSWPKNKDLERSTVCIRKNMPVEPGQAQDVIKAIDTKNSEVIGYGSVFLRTPNPWIKNSQMIKFQYSFSNKKGTSTLLVHDISSGSYGSYPLIAHTVTQADIFYAKLSETAEKIQNCK